MSDYCENGTAHIDAFWSLGISGHGGYMHGYLYASRSRCSSVNQVLPLCACRQSMHGKPHEKSCRMTLSFQLPGILGSLGLVVRALKFGSGLSLSPTTSHTNVMISSLQANLDEYIMYLECGKGGSFRR